MGNNTSSLSNAKFHGQWSYLYTSSYKANMNQTFGWNVKGVGWSKNLAMYFYITYWFKYFKAIYINGSVSCSLTLTVIVLLAKIILLYTHLYKETLFECICFIKISLSKKEVTSPTISTMKNLASTCQAKNYGGLHHVLRHHLCQTACWLATCSCERPFIKRSQISFSQTTETDQYNKSTYAYIWVNRYKIAYKQQQ